MIVYFFLFLLQLFFEFLKVDAEVLHDLLVFDDLLWSCRNHVKFWKFAFIWDRLIKLVFKIWLICWGLSGWLNLVDIIISLFALLIALEFEDTNNRDLVVEFELRDIFGVHFQEAGDTFALWTQLSISHILNPRINIADRNTKWVSALLHVTIIRDHSKLVIKFTLVGSRLFFT